MKPEEAIEKVKDMRDYIIREHSPNDVFVSNMNEAIKALERPHGECKTCKHYVKGKIDGKTYVCEHPEIQLEDYYDYACILVEKNDFCSSYEPKEGEAE